MLYNVVSDACNDCSVEFLYLAVALEVICSRQVLNFQKALKAGKELRDELWSVISH